MAHPKFDRNCLAVKKLSERTNKLFIETNLVPLTQEPVTVVGAVREPLPHLVDKLVNEHLPALLTATTAKDEP